MKQVNKGRKNSPPTQQKHTTKQKNANPRQKQRIVERNKVHILLALLAIVVLTFIAYYPSFNNGITNFDDNLYITESPYVRESSAKHVKQLFVRSEQDRASEKQRTGKEASKLSYYMGNYHPLSMWSLALDYNKEAPQDYSSFHRTNFILHILNTLLVFFFVYYLIGFIEKNSSYKKLWNLELATITALLFGVHTIHVESVAWVSERKDVLYTFFFLASLILYLKYIITEKSSFLIGSIVVFLLSLLSKGQAVSLAVTVIAVDFVVGRKLLDKKVILEKVPYLFLAITFGIIAILAQQSSKSIALNDPWNLSHRIFFASYGLVQYVFKMVLPLNLSTFYPYPRYTDGSLPALFYVMPLAVMAIIAAFVVSLKKSKEIAFGILFFAVNIFLVLQLLPVGKAIMADRYSYIPSIGFFLIIAIGVRYLGEKIPKALSPTLAVIAIWSIGLTYLSVERSKLWGDSLFLWNNVLEQFEDCELAYNNRGDILSNKPTKTNEERIANYKQALKDFNRALELDKNYETTYYNRGVVRSHLGDKEGALQDFNKAISLKADYAQAYCNRGATKFELSNNMINGKHLFHITKEVVQKLRSEGVNPIVCDKLQKIIDTKFATPQLMVQQLNGYLGAQEFSKIQNNILVYSKTEEYKNSLATRSDAITDFTTALTHKPDYLIAYTNRGSAFAMLGQNSNALADYSYALRLSPNDPKLYLMRGRIYRAMRKQKEACQDLNLVLRMAPNSSLAKQAQGLMKGFCK